jgi:hypothetical protein
VNPDTVAALSLLNGDAVRTRAQHLFALACEDRLLHFQIDPDPLDAVAELVIETMRTAYPSLDVPLHSRWRHFDFQVTSLFNPASGALGCTSKRESARSAFDFVIVSVLLDAGAGPDWRYKDPASGQTIGRSEGLALASLTMFQDGLFSSSPGDPLRVDAAVLAKIPAETVKRGLQITKTNPITGVDGRIALLHRLGRIVNENPSVFGRHDSPRPGGLFDLLVDNRQDDSVSAPAILTDVLTHFGEVWPSRFRLGGVPLGDCWYHPLITTADATSGFLPLHKLSQWLAYSLIEPLQWAGNKVVNLDGLTGLAEYRNGGLFIDTNVLKLRDPSQTKREHDVSSVLVVEWRGLTVALLDLLATKIRQRLDRGAESLPLVKILQGGTWAAGRVLASQLRPNAVPPIRILSDGSVF